MARLLSFIKWVIIRSWSTSAEVEVAHAGNTTSIGFHEAEDVTKDYRFIKKMNAQPIILCGTSMGAAAVMKFLQDQQADVRGIILECPFGTIYQTVANRFEAMHLPELPLAYLLLFYGSV